MQACFFTVVSRTIDHHGKGIRYRVTQARLPREHVLTPSGLYIREAKAGQDSALGCFIFRV